MRGTLLVYLDGFGMEHFRKEYFREAFSVADARGASICYLKSTCNAVTQYISRERTLKKVGLFFYFNPSRLLEK